MTCWITRRILGTGAAWLLAGLLAAGCGAGGGASQTGTTSQVQPATPTPGGLPPIPPLPPLGRKTTGLLLAGESGTSAPRPDPSGTLNLGQGWNLVSFGVAHLDRVDTNADVHPKLFAYDPSAGGYQSVDLEASDINDMGATRAFWVYANKSLSLSYDGTGDVTEARLQKGWNMVGLPGLPVSLGQTAAVVQPGGSPSPLPQVVSTDNPAPAGSLAYANGFIYSPASKSYQTMNLADAGTRTAMGQGLWVYAHATGTISWLPGPPASGVPGSGPPAAAPGQAPPDAPNLPGPPPVPPDEGPKP